jgi:hypothetical protein
MTLMEVNKNTNKPIKIPEFPIIGGRFSINAGKSRASLFIALLFVKMQISHELMSSYSNDNVF